MLICEQCGADFSKEDCGTYVEMHGFKYGLGETYLQCPYCGGIDVYEAKLCNGCDEYFCGEYVQTLNGEIYCERCFVIKNTEDI